MMEMIKIRMEIKQRIEKFNETKSWFAGKSNKIDKLLNKLFKKKRRIEIIKSGMKAGYLLQNLQK